MHTIIIGGTKGLGYAVAKLLNTEGHTLSILARKKPLQTLLNASYYEVDLLQEESYLIKLSEIINKIGKVQNLIFVQRYRGDQDCWQSELEVSVNATRKIIDYLKDKFAIHKNASIVIASSIAGKYATVSQPLSYSVAKASLNQMIQHYAAELGYLTIRVNGVSSYSFVKEESHQFYADNQSLQNLYQQIIPLKRMCTANDIANVISFLCSDKASFVSGQNIIVDGGLSIVNHEVMARNVREC